jgi:hypothetical protein
MTKQSNVFNDGSPEPSSGQWPQASSFSSGAVVKTSAIAPRDIIDGLPEELLRWLHEDLDRKTLPRLLTQQVSQIDFESVVVDRLFPLRDNRAFVRRLRSHCQATATAAGMLAELKRQSARVATVCGWLHDIGIASCIRHADEVSPIANDEALAVVWPSIRRSSAQHAIRLASRWRLPSAIRHAIRDHESFIAVGSPNPIVAATVIAEHIAAVIGCAFHEPVPAAIVDRATSVLRLTEGDVLVVAGRVEKTLRHARTPFPTSRIAWGA